MEGAASGTPTGQGAASSATTISGRALFLEGSRGPEARQWRVSMALAVRIPPHPRPLPHWGEGKFAMRCGGSSQCSAPPKVNRADAAWEVGRSGRQAGKPRCTETRPGYDERHGCGLKVLIFATYSTGSNSTITALYSPSPIFSGVIAMPDSQKTSPAE